MFFSHAASCSVACPDGTLFTFAVRAGLFVASSQILADRQANSYACRQAALLRVCMGTLGENGCVGGAYSQPIPVTGHGPFSFVIVAGALPPGLTLSPTGAAAATITGTPTTAGNFTFTLQATDSLGHTITKTFTLYVLNIGNTSSLPPDTTNIPYSEQLHGAGGVQPYTFSIVSGSLAPGLTMDTNGLISGTPTNNADSSFTVEIEDDLGNTCQKAFTIHNVFQAFNVCNLAGVLAAMSVANCPVSGLPAWDGVFNLKTSDPTNPGSVIWYFINQSIKGRSLAASDTPDYPGGPWQSNDCFCSLFFDPTGLPAPHWTLNFQCSDCSNPFTSWWVGTLAKNDPNDPTGVYVAAFPPAVTPNTITIKSVFATNPPEPNWSNELLWTTGVSSNGAGSGSITPATGTTSASFDCQATNPVPEGAGHFVHASGVGKITNYNGPLVSCNLHLTISGSNLSINSGADGKAWSRILVQVGGFPVLDVNSGTLGTGTFDIPFSFSTVCGTPQDVVVTVNADIGNGGGAGTNPSNIHTTGTITNLS